MLGVASPREPITGRFAHDLRETLARKQYGNLNKEDKERIAFRSKTGKVQITKGF